MDLTLLLIQTLNGVQYGLLLFLIASGLTIVFGIMGVINLAHGSFYMIGAYLAWSLTSWTGSIFWAVLLGAPLAALLGLLVERLFIVHLYHRDHLQQVLLTFGLILIFNEMQSIIWGDDPHSIPKPEFLQGSIPLTEVQAYPAYNLFLALVCLALAGVMYWVVQKTRLGMRIRAGSSNPEMIQALGINTKVLFATVFSIGVTMAALAGLLAAPERSIYPGIGEQVLIISFVVVVIGGIGSIKGAFVGALLIGLMDSLGATILRSFDDVELMSGLSVDNLTSVTVYALMAAILLWRPAGLYGRAH
ncbi:MAG: branched-chain amino acid ABC transporter permease [Marivibrio sp.]|uniref:branched-chain amino acid ABC transporter permease n=1 Tax=Marivibrio sp. TaxID=2039719 RepID=UPI0032EDA7FA